ncbi:MAG: DEAD/DEAH box helicase [Paludibacteraceae bacterium]
MQTKPQIKIDLYETAYSLPKHIKQYVDSIKYYEFVKIEDPKLQGFVKACSTHRISKEISVYLWNEIICNNANQKSADIYTRQKHKQYSNINHCQSSFLYDLLNNKWIYNKDEQLCNINDIHLEDLSPEYNLSNGVAEFLGITKAVENLTEKYGVTQEEQKVYDLGAKLVAAMGGSCTPEEVFAAVKEIRSKKEKEATKNVTQHATDDVQLETNITPQASNPEPTKYSIEERLQKKIEEKKNRHVGKPHSSNSNREVEPFEIKNPEVPSSQNYAPFFVGLNEPINTPSVDVEETARAEKNLKAKNTQAKEQAEASSEQVELLDLLNQTTKYTFKWFKILMLLMHQGQDELTKRRVQIDFSHYELQCSDKIMHLTEPNLPVPAWVSDAEKYSITIISDGKPEKLDGFIVKTEDNSIDLSIEINVKMEIILQQTKKIRIIAEDNTNIIDSLETRFLQLEKEDDFDMNENLPTNISFIYGPPGTGKTTELVRQVHDLLEKEPEAKILVLTPTNKAADVVAIKMANDNICEGGLARFGATESLYLIEEIGCVTNRDTTDLKDWHNIVVATAARYAYDYVQPDDTPICDYPWDYIFVDEASMIDILTITYILYKGAEAKKIIISGDPMQIQPVVQNDMPDYNIYDMVNLHGFSEAIFDYDRFDVKGLTMQHRSIPIIGNLVSKFAYDGLVDSDPNRAPMKPLKLDGINIQNINFVGFDVAELDEIKGLNSVNNSAFNLYSVIFTYNMIEYIIKQIEKHYPEKDYTIGIVCAYRAQSDAIKNMLENRPLDTMYCKVSCGTVHSFQGDECDIMFIVLNPPAICTSGTHVNNTNIINVAMSRARDYIFFVMPNGQQKGFFMKNKIGRQFSNIFDRTIIKCEDVEQVMFQGNGNFIYENTHVTCHMPVNVYCEDNALYEVRMSDNAIDIKINQHLLNNAI